MGRINRFTFLLSAHNLVQSQKNIRVFIISEIKKTNILKEEKIE